MEKEVDVNAVLKNLREFVGAQAQEIAVLKARLEEISTTNP